MKIPSLETYTIAVYDLIDLARADERNTYTKDDSTYDALYKARRELIRKIAILHTAFLELDGKRGIKRNVPDE